ncbi:MAG: NAD(P)-dependent oxidoreductase [Rhizobiales bacterium]|nr:NAD(P)-dependent oxidoreductase [Hyphomicrobiales bacterium]
MKVAFLGIGLMGAPMVRNLLKAEFEVSVWNRSPGKAAALVSNGAAHCTSAAKAVTGADIVITMLFDDNASKSVLIDSGLCDEISAGAIVIEMGSMTPEQACANAKHLQKCNINYLDAPVSGGTKGADAASLAIMVGGDEKTFEKSLTVLSAMGRAVVVGPVGSGQLAKLCNQAITAVTIGAVAEAILLMKTAGADPSRLPDALAGGFADSIILQQHGRRMIQGDFEPGGRSTVQLKDLNNIVAAANQQGLTLPLANQVRERYGDLVNNLGHADADHSALFLELLATNELDYSQLFS